MSDPETKVQVVESWAGMAKDARKRKAAEACRDDQRGILQSLLESYVLTCSRSGIDTSPRTLDIYWRGAKRLLDWCSANGYKVHAIKGEQVQRFIASMANLSPKTRQVHLSGAKSMIWALRWVGMGEGDPFTDANGRAIRVRDPNPVEDKADPYTLDEIERLLEGADERERALILLGADGGLRLAEMQGLRRSGVDQERNILKFTGKWSKAAKVKVTDRVMEAIDALPRDGKSDKVFKVGRRRLQQIFTRRCKDVGVKARGVHNLRHSCGTRLYNLTGKLTIVKRHLRHSSTKSTEMYVHLADTDYFAAVKALE